MTQDHLGSPRIITDSIGKIIARKDFGAFGDETFTSQRTTALGYKPEEVRQDYTGYQKDDESSLEFAQARYYNSAHGRFTSVDPLTASANVKDPQTFNRYSYSLNSPYKFTDPLGLVARDTGAGSSHGSDVDHGYLRNPKGYDLDFANSFDWVEDEMPVEQTDTATVAQTQGQTTPPPTRPAPTPPIDSSLAGSEDYQEFNKIPRPTSASYEVDSLEIANDITTNPNVFAPRLSLIITVLDQFEQLFVGTVRETVTSPNENVTNSNPVELVDGQFRDFVYKEIVTWDHPPTTSDRAYMEQHFETKNSSTNQTATFTVTGPNTSSSLTIVMQRALYNGTRNGVFTLNNSGTNYKYQIPVFNVTPKP